MDERDVRVSDLTKIRFGTVRGAGWGGESKRWDHFGAHRRMQASEGIESKTLDASQEDERSFADKSC